MWGVGPFLLILLVVLHPLKPLPGEVLEHDVVVICVKLYQVCIYGSFVLWNVPMRRLLSGFGVHQGEGQLHCHVTGGEVSQQASS